MVVLPSLFQHLRSFRGFLRCVITFAKSAKLRAQGDRIDIDPLIGITLLRETLSAFPSHTHTRHARFDCNKVVPRHLGRRISRGRAKSTPETATPPGIANFAGDEATCSPTLLGRKVIKGESLTRLVSLVPEGQGGRSVFAWSGIYASEIKFVAEHDTRRRKR